MKLLLQVQDAFNPLAVLTKQKINHGIVTKNQKNLCKCNYVNLLSIHTQRCKAYGLF